MACDEQSWSVRFPDVPGENGPFEFRPYTLTLKSERGKFDYARVKANADVGYEMMVHTDEAGGLLRKPTRAQIRLDGRTVNVMYFKPDLAEYGDDYTHLEFRDLHEAMDGTVLDMKHANIHLKNAYRLVFEHVESDLITDLKFTNIENVVDVLIGDTSATNREVVGASDVPQVGVEGEQTKRITESNYAIDFENLSPAAAFMRLNSKFRVSSWVDNDGVLWVGIPEALASRHVAAPDDGRVWRYENVQVRHPSEPIKEVHVQGAWVDQDGISLDPITNWFNDVSGDGFTGDVRAHGVAYRTDLNVGRSIVVKPDKDSLPKKDAVTAVAMQFMREKMREQNNGTVKLNPAKSGNFTPLQDLSIGDALHIVPRDEPYKKNDITISEETGDLTQLADLKRDGVFRDYCEDLPANEVYTVNSITHRVDDTGDYTITVGVGMFPYDIPLDSKLRFFDPQSEEYLHSNEVFDGGWQEDDEGTYYDKWN